MIDRGARSVLISFGLSSFTTTFSLGLGSIGIYHTGLSCRWTASSNGVRCGGNKRETEKLNGWYPWLEYTFSDDASSSTQSAGCAVFTAPLYYPGICKSQVVMLDISVKRIMAETASAENATNVWLLPGGLVSAPSGMEPSTVRLHSQLNGTANSYAIDHRGTRRSTFFDCVVAQAATTGFPVGGYFGASVVPSCDQPLEIKFGNLAAFSLASASMDLKTLISKFSTGCSSIMYGVSYGTAVVERLMHLDIGYVLAGVATTSGAPPGKFEYFSTWEEGFGEVGDYIFVSAPKTTIAVLISRREKLSASLEDLLVDCDRNPNSTCATLVSNQTIGWGNVKLSFKLRQRLGSILNSPKKRNLIPPLVYRLSRCVAKDIDVLNSVFRGLDENRNSSYESGTYYSVFLSPAKISCWGMSCFIS
ncbi:hypothetical protein PC120_g16010 [Phytophthora cactorum]|nr:hypothetical protein PC120_g16010 [Phytophthora cactorum]